MLELPEALVVAGQIDSQLGRKRIVAVTVNQTPHKFAWFHGDPQQYHDRLKDKMIERAQAHGGMVEILAAEARIVFSDGVNIRYIARGEKLPSKQQLRLEFEDSSSLVAAVQMYGGLWAFSDGDFQNPYYRQARESPSPLGDQFDYRHFESLLAGTKSLSLSAKAFLATEQRIPGLGNGVLQDILWTARLHPKRRMATLSAAELQGVFTAVKTVLADMVANGGRDTEGDLYGRPGGYQTILSRRTVSQPCPACGTPIAKQAYMGGSIYFCAGCQPV